MERQRPEGKNVDALRQFDAALVKGKAQDHIGLTKHFQQVPGLPDDTISVALQVSTPRGLAPSPTYFLHPEHMSSIVESYPTTHFSGASYLVSYFPNGNQGLGEAALFDITPEDPLAFPTSESQEISKADIVEAALEVPDAYRKSSAFPNFYVDKLIEKELKIKGVEPRIVTRIDLDDDTTRILSVSPSDDTNAIGRLNSGQEELGWNYSYKITLAGRMERELYAYTDGLFLQIDVDDADAPVSTIPKSGAMLPSIDYTEKNSLEVTVIMKDPMPISMGKDIQFDSALHDHLRRLNGPQQVKQGFARPASRAILTRSLKATDPNVAILEDQVPVKPYTDQFVAHVANGPHGQELLQGQFALNPPEDALWTDPEYMVASHLFGGGAQVRRGEKQVRPFATGIEKVTEKMHMIFDSAHWYKQKT